jgi:predicted DNA-binding ribbon-helix-helix protein
MDNLEINHRVVLVEGRRYSIEMNQRFWAVLGLMAAERDLPVNRLIQSLRETWIEAAPAGRSLRTTFTRHIENAALAWMQRQMKLPQ